MAPCTNGVRIQRDMFADVLEWSVTSLKKDFVTGEAIGAGFRLELLCFKSLLAVERCITRCLLCVESRGT